MEVINNIFDEEVINNEGISIVYFWADWCNNCKMFNKIFENTSKKFDDIKFCKLNVDNNKNITKKYAVMSIPTIIVFKNGKEIKRSVGPLNEEQLKKLILI